MDLPTIRVNSSNSCENRTITKMQNTERRSFLQLAFAGHDDTLTISEKQQAAWMANLPIPMLRQYRSNLARLRGSEYLSRSASTSAFDSGTTGSPAGTEIARIYS